jgi:hypothetical protein
LLRGSRPDAWLTATVHHPHFSGAALADRGTHRGVSYANAINQLTPEATSLTNLNDRVVRLLKWDVRHTLCGGHNAQREHNDGGSDHCFSPVVTQTEADDFTIGSAHIGQRRRAAQYPYPPGQTQLPYAS